MEYIKYPLLAVSMVAGYVGPIKAGIAAAKPLGYIAASFAGAEYGVAGLFGILAAIGAVAPLVIADKHDWL